MKYGRKMVNQFFSKMFSGSRDSVCRTIFIASVYISLYSVYHPLPANPLPPSTFTHPNPPNSSRSSPHLFSMTLSVPFAALFDPIKVFDCLDHTFPPKKKHLTHVSACVIFQLRPHPPGIQSFLTWHSKRMSFLYCSLNGTASNWHDPLLYVYINDWSSPFKLS